VACRTKIYGLITRLLTAKWVRYGDTDAFKTLRRDECHQPAKAASDALHIAIAAVHGMDFLVTWNCRHIANARMIRFVTQTCEAAGYRVPVICTPEELGEE